MKKIKVSEVAQFSILLSTWNWNLENLEKFSFTSIAGGIENSKS